MTINFFGESIKLKHVRLAKLSDSTVNYYFNPQRDIRPIVSAGSIKLSGETEIESDRRILKVYTVNGRPSFIYWDSGYKSIELIHEGA